ncbi:MAG: LysR family transcriptional regulator [Deinococcota bacterium]
MAQRLKAEALLAFCKAAQLNSVSEAARALGISQPAVSSQLVSLQTLVGRELYERSPHGIRLTAAGKQLLPYACAVAESLLQARRYLKGDAQHGLVELKLGLSHHLVSRFTVPLLRAERDYNQQQSLQSLLSEGYSQQLTDSVRQRDLDAAIILGEPKDVAPPLMASRVGEDEICLLVKEDDPFGKQAYLPLTSVEGETLILSSSISRVYKRVQDYLARAQVTPGRIVVVSGPAAVRLAVQEGMGIGVTLRSFVACEVHAGWLRCIALEDPGFTVGITQIHHDLATFEPAKRQALQRVLADLHH